MNTNTNPFAEQEFPNNQHVQSIVRSALQEWTQRQKLPHYVEGNRGPVEMTTDDFYRIQGIVVLLLNENKDKVDRWMKPKDEPKVER